MSKIETLTQRQLSLLERYNGQVPRYTSYPTAPHFNHEISSPAYAEILARQPAGSVFSLYLHIPFCHALCFYCGCFTKVVNNDEPVQAYLKSLLQEIKLAGEATGKKVDVAHIHFGGGSPNLLKADDMARLLDTLRENFSIGENAEIAVEMDPRLLDREKIARYPKMGITRASLGIQDFQPDVQKAINRIQPFNMVKRCVDDLRDSGIAAINFDLIYGLPLQTLAYLEDNVEKAVSLDPDRLALFGYAHVPWMRPHQKLLDQYPMPDEQERFLQCERARQTLIDSGYDAIGIDHFAKPDDELSVMYRNRTLRRNFQGYTTDHASALIGMGLSAISAFPQGYIQNTSDPIEYRQNLAGDSFPLERGCLVGGEDLLRRDVIQTLMCYFEADIQDICSIHDTPIHALRDSLLAVQPMVRDGLVTIEGYKITATESGRPFIRAVCACFDEYFESSAKRHARAI